MERFLNTKLVGHPLNWLIIVVVTILACILIDSFLTYFGLDKPVTRANRASGNTMDETPPTPAPPV